jgi:drug/metabolite transporter (DMT)-like permease
MQQFIGLFAVLFAGIGFGFLGIFGKLAFDTGMPVGLLLSLRFFIAGLILLLGMLLFQRKLILLSRKQILISCFLGFFGYAVFSSLYFMSIEGLSVSLSAMLLFTFPLFVNLGEHFILKNKMTIFEIANLIVAFIGLIFLMWGPVFFESFIYILYALGAALTYSIYVLVSGQAQKNVHPLSSSLYVIFSAAFGLWIFHSPNLTSDIFFMHQNQWLYVLGLSVLCTILPISLFLWGLQKMKSGLASLIVMIEPVVAALAAWLLLDETLHLLQYFGMLLVLGSLITGSIKKLKSRT